MFFAFKKPVLWLSFLLLISSALLLAQSERGTISGTVRDTSGAVVPGAKIVVTNTATGVATTLTSNEVGEFTVANVQVGTYNVEVSNQGFRPAEIKGLTVNAATSVRADFNIEVGQSQQVVEVQASAVQLQTEDAKTSVTISEKLVNDLPLVVGGAVRSPFDLAFLPRKPRTWAAMPAFPWAGAKAAAYGTTLDGVSADTSRALQKSWVTTNAPSVEALTEFTVDTNGFKAEYGHAGGGVMTFVTKSGTNHYHGSAYEFLRNNDFDANDWFSNRLGRPRQIYKQNDFGFTVGGPVWIPKIYNGQKQDVLLLLAGRFPQSQWRD